MSTAAFTDLVPLTTPAGGDIIAIVDISDSTQSPSGSTKQMTLDNMFVRGTVTTSQPIINATQTWNAGGVTFAGVKIAITNTASAAASLPFQILGGAGGVTNLLSLRIDGLTTIGSGMTITSAGVVAGVTTLDVSGTVSSSATGVIVNAIGASTSAKAIRMSNTGGDVYLGIESSVGGSFFAGSTAYASVLYSPGTVPVQVIVNATLRASITTSGVDVVGLLTATRTTEQMRLSYDGTYRLGVTVSSTGQVTFETTATSGANQVFSFSGPVADATLLAVDGSIQTTIGSAWDLGAYTAAGVSFDTTHYVAVKIGGVAYKLAVVT